MKSIERLFGLFLEDIISPEKFSCCVGENNRSNSRHPEWFDRVRRKEDFIVG
jgi:hypothetical protein